MARNRLFFLCFCGFLWYQNAHSQPEQGLYLTSLDQKSEDDWTNIVLLPDTGGRVRREATNSSEDTKNSDNSNNIPPVIAQSSVEGDVSDSGSDGRRGATSGTGLFTDFNNVDITDDKMNKTFQQKNYTLANNDTFKYYKSTFIPNGKDYFKDLEQFNKTGKTKGGVKEHNMLSQSYRRAATITLSFLFPFYGHEVKNITIATGGFLYTGDYVHSWLAATQYIAPLMANFDTSKNENAKIRYLDTGEFLVVEWKDVHLQEREMEGTFTFQVILNRSGDIHFAYKDIPLSITTLQDEEHPVKVGLSDAYIIDRTIFFVRRKTIYEYHRLNKKGENITNWSAIIFRALPTCNRQDTCEKCLRPEVSSPQPDLKCQWCDKQKRCSDGMDRQRQEWLTANCDQLSVSRRDQCGKGSQDSDWPSRSNSGPGGSRFPDGQLAEPSHAGHPVSPGGLVALILTFLLVFSLIGWVGYAYFYPHTWSGQILIKYRPSAWRWRQSGARYTAASIHM